MERAVRSLLERPVSPMIENWLSSIILGDLRGLSKDLIDSFRATGLLHLLVVSGLHIGFFAIAALFIFALLEFSTRSGCSRWSLGQDLLCVHGHLDCCCCHFSFFIGFKPPAQRAALLAVVATISSFARTQSQAPAIFCGQ